MTRPVRLQLRRAKGFDLQVASIAANGLPAISVARPGPHGNPFLVGRDGDAEHCVYLHRYALRGLYALTCGVPVAVQRATRSSFFASWRYQRGHNLACWCRPGAPCHADTLLEAIEILEKTDG